MNLSLYQTNSYENPNYSGGPFMHNSSARYLNITTAVNALEMVPNSDDFPPILGRQHMPLVSANENQSCGSSNAPLMSIEETTSSSSQFRRVHLELDLGSLQEVWVAVLNITGPLASWSFTE